MAILTKPKSKWVETKDWIGERFRFNASLTGENHLIDEKTYQLKTYQEKVVELVSVVEEQKKSITILKKTSPTKLTELEKVNNNLEKERKNYQELYQKELEKNLKLKKQLGELNENRNKGIEFFNAKKREFEEKIEGLEKEKKKLIQEKNEIDASLPQKDKELRETKQQLENLQGSLRGLNNRGRILAVKEMELEEFRTLHAELENYFGEVSLKQLWRYVNDTFQDYFNGKKETENVLSEEQIEQEKNEEIEDLKNRLQELERKFQQQQDNYQELLDKIELLD